MPKMKTKSGSKKRFTVTGSGKIRRNQAFVRHILTSKTRKRKRNLRQAALIDTADMKLIQRALALR
ncbi:MAG: 50S ribosomal protein L35 [Candidatus Kapaibacterium sp.]